jgi:hypothetical protein
MSKTIERGRSTLICLFAAVASLAVAAPVTAHHSYAMFDASKTLTVAGTVAKLEWMNPHVFVWVYVSDSSAKGGYALYAFENGSPNVLTRLGWNKATFKAGEQISIEYWPLKDGRSGGHFLSATYADGRVIRGAGGPDSAKAVPALDGRKP